MTKDRMETTQAQAGSDVAAQHAIIGNATAQPQAGFQRTAHPDAQWFPGSLGLFIHWGIASVSGAGDLSWSMMLTLPGDRTVRLGCYGLPAVQCQLTPNAYWQQAERFKPDRYCPDQWLAAAKSAGFHYAVFTTKHHDGYTLWPSRQDGFGVQTFNPGVDLVRDYVAACRRQGLKVGLYYSPPDWRFERERRSFGETLGSDGARIKVGLDHEPIAAADLPSREDPAFVRAWQARVKGQIRELLTSYGPIDLFWFDGSAGGAVTPEELRALQPGMLFNDRGFGFGDYGTPECAFPQRRPQGWWEYCHIWNDGAWGYLGHEVYKPTGWMLGEWAKARAWGGNFLVNVGPNARGELPAVAYRRLDELGRWQAQLGHTLGDAVTAGPWPERCNAPTTVCGSTWYVHLVFDWDERAVVIKETRRPQAVRLLGGESPRDLAWSIQDGDLQIPIRKSGRGIMPDVVEIVF